MASEQLLEEIQKKLQELRVLFSQAKEESNTADLEGCNCLLSAIIVVIEKGNKHHAFSSIFNGINVLSCHFEEELGDIFKRAGYVLEKGRKRMTKKTINGTSILGDKLILNISDEACARFGTKHGEIVSEDISPNIRFAVGVAPSIKTAPNLSGIVEGEEVLWLSREKSETTGLTFSLKRPIK